MSSQTRSGMLRTRIAMTCCTAQKEQRSRRRGWRSAGGTIGSGTLLLLLPKCPMCIAAYLTVLTGAGVAMPLASHLCLVLEIIFALSVLLLLARYGALRWIPSRRCNATFLRNHPHDV
jgi:hypothetical protein